MGRSNTISVSGSDTDVIHALDIGLRLPIHVPFKTCNIVWRKTGESPSGRVTAAKKPVNYTSVFSTEVEEINMINNTLLLLVFYSNDPLAFNRENTVGPP